MLLIQLSLILMATIIIMNISKYATPDIREHLIQFITLNLITGNF